LPEVLGRRVSDFPKHELFGSAIPAYSNNSATAAAKSGFSRLWAYPSLTWLRGQHCLEDIKKFWMAHKPTTMSEVYSHLHGDVEMHLAEAERVGYGFDLPKTPSLSVVPNVAKSQEQNDKEVAS
jgi:hypothetical protein